MKIVISVIGLVLVLLLGPLYMAAYGSDEPQSRSWRTASRTSAGIAPAPQEHNGALIQAYAARAYSWRGHLGVHTWLATKATGAEQYQVHHVLGWRGRRGLPVVESVNEIPDRFWYGNRPELLLDIRGQQAEELIPHVLEAVASYPYPDDYTIWPGPNSNTFTAHIGRQVPELGLELPVTAIGKDYMGATIIGAVPSGSGYQVSLLGALGLMVAGREGIELNILGLSLGLDFDQFALKFPGVGRVGQAHQPTKPDQLPLASHHLPDFVPSTGSPETMTVLLQPVP